MLVFFLGYRIHPTARIGLSIVCPDRLEMDRESRIGSLTVGKGLALLKMRENAVIGNLNWITGFPAHDKSSSSAESDRRPELILGSDAAITNRHFIDYTDSIQIGNFATFAGCNSQILTHSIDLYQCGSHAGLLSSGIAASWAQEALYSEVAFYLIILFLRRVRFSISHTRISMFFTLGARREPSRNCKKIWGTSTARRDLLTNVIPVAERRCTGKDWSRRWISMK